MEEILALKSAYSIIAERNNDAEWKKKAEIMEYLSELTKNEMLDIFNTGYFNNIVLGYVFTALKLKNTSKKDIKEILSIIESLFDEMRASEAEEAYNNFFFNNRF